MAAQIQNKFTFISNAIEFKQRVGLLDDYREIQWLDLVPQSMGGMFFSQDVETLQQFCRDNDAYHIVTCTDPLRMENRYLPGYRIYHLANGDKDSTLVHSEYLNPNRLIEDEDFAPVILDRLREIKQRRRS